MKKLKIFVVHPFESAKGTYSVSYSPNNNKTNKSFKKWATAKKYIKMLGTKLKETHFLYDHPNGTKIVLTGYKNN